MPIQPFDIARSMSAASGMAKTSMALQDYAQERKSEDAIKTARGEAVSGEPDAIKALMKLSPEDAGEIIDNLAGMDEAGRKQIKADSERVAKQMMWVMQGENEQAQGDRWEQVVDFLTKAGDEGAEAYRGQFSPALAENLIMKAMTVDDINEQFSFGQLKVGQQDGKDVYIQTNPVGQTRVAPVPEGVSPIEKETYVSKGAGDKPFSMKASDSNSIRSSAAALFGGTWDPQTGRVSGIERGQQKNVLAISERASRIYADGKGKVTHAEAAAKASRELKIDVPKAQPQGIKAYLETQRANQ